MSNTVGLFKELTVLREENIRLKEKCTELSQAIKQESDNDRPVAEDYLATVSHDLLQPINAAKLFLDEIVGEVSSESYSPSTQKAVHALQFSIQSMDAMLSSLISISKLDAGHIHPIYDYFCINDLLENLAHESAVVLENKPISFRYIPSYSQVYSDSQLLARIVRNFLSNACRYTSEGKVLLGCRRRSNGLEIQVVDTGCGITKDKRQSIFLAFTRDVEKQQGTYDQGLGLGLSIVEKIADLLGHRIQVQSGVGKGSVFSILVPYKQP